MSFFVRPRCDGSFRSSLLITPEVSAHERRLARTSLRPTPRAPVPHPRWLCPRPPHHWPPCPRAAAAYPQAYPAPLRPILRPTYPQVYLSSGLPTLRPILRPIHRPTPRPCALSARHLCAYTHRTAATPCVPTPPPALKPPSGTQGGRVRTSLPGYTCPRRLLRALPQMPASLHAMRVHTSSTPHRCGSAHLHPHDRSAQRPRLPQNTTHSEMSTYKK